MTVVEDVVWNQIVNNSDNSGSSDLFYERKWEWTYLRVRVMILSAAGKFS